MGTTNNWAQDGLNAYLALTGEHRADKKAEADLAYQKEQSALQRDQFGLAKNADERSAAAAGLTNQVTQLSIDEGKRKASDIAKTDAAIRDFITMKTASDDSIPNTLDPLAIAASRKMAADLAHTANTLNNMPEGTAEFDMKSLPPSAQTVLMEGPGKAAMLRKGVQHTDPATGQTYTMTGELGMVRVVKESGKPTMVVPTMVATNDKTGAVIEVPYTENKTNASNDAVKYVTPDMLFHRAGSTLTALDQAEKTGISPAVAYSENIYRMVQSLPYEQRVAWLGKEVEKETSRRDKYTSDTETSKAAKPFADKIESLTGTPEEKRTAATAIMLGAPAAVVEHLLKTSKSVHDMFPDSKKTYSSVETADGVFMVDATNPGNKVRIGGLKPDRKDGKGKSDIIELKDRERLVSIDKDIKELHVDNRSLRKSLVGAFDKGIIASVNKEIEANNQRIQSLQADKVSLLQRGDTSPSESPATRGMDDVSAAQRAKVDGAANILTGGKPQSLGQSLGLYNTNL